MFKIASEILAKLGSRAQRNPTDAASDPLVEKMMNLAWVPTEDDRSALKYLAESDGKDRAPLAEIMASSYLGRYREQGD